MHAGPQGPVYLVGPAFPLRGWKLPLSHTLGWIPFLGPQSLAWLPVSVFYCSYICLKDLPLWPPALDSFH
jgi:hypothetical protein